MSGLDHELAAARPEIVITTLLQHALGATRSALAIAHPELAYEHLEFDQADDVTHLALLIAIHLADIDALLGQYRDAVEAQWRSYDSDLPF